MSDLKQELARLRHSFDESIARVQGHSSQAVEQLRVQFLGKKGELTAILRSMGQLSADERPAVGQLANQVREHMESSLENLLQMVKANERAQRLELDRIDVTLPGQRLAQGTRHPLTKVIDEICDVFVGLGFAIAEGPEVELDEYNFELLRIPEAIRRATRRTRSTSPTRWFCAPRRHRSRSRVMKEQQPPIKIVCPGKVYRSDALDAPSPIFHQIEGLVVDHGVTMGDLVGSLQLFARQLFGEKTEIRLRPHHFPFTEPSCEVDITCWSCGGTGCRTCKGEGWIEVLGAGMVHPGVLRNCGIDPDIYSGFAFGIGVERTAMGRYGIDDIRNFYENDLRFLRQFR